MKHVKVLKWTEKTGEKIKKSDGTEEDKYIEVDTLKALSVLLQMNKQDDIPKGLDGFRTYHRLAKAFDEADKTGTLVLEEIDYKFLKTTVEKNIPSTWGFNTDVTNAVEEFLNAKE